MPEIQDLSWLDWDAWIETPLVHPYELADFIQCPENDSKEVQLARRWLYGSNVGGDNRHLKSILDVPEVQNALKSMGLGRWEWWFAERIYWCCKDLPYHDYYGL